MIKISAWICGVCVIAWIIIAVFVIYPIEPTLSSKDWPIAFIIGFILGIVSFGLSYLGGNAIKGNKWAIRLIILISVLWIVGWFVGLEPYYGNWDDYLVISLTPIIFYLGILWVIARFSRKGDSEIDP